MYPSSRNPRRKASTSPEGPGAPPNRNPTRGTFTAGCAWATSGEARRKPRPVTKRRRSSIFTAIHVPLDPSSCASNAHAQRTEGEQGEPPVRCSVVVGGATLLGNLVRPQQERGRDGQAKPLCGLEIDRKLKLGRLLDGQLGRLGPFQNPVDIPGSDTPSFLEVVSVGDETTGGNEPPLAAHRRQPVPRRELDDAGLASSHDERVWSHDEAVWPLSKDGGEYRFELGWLPFY